MITHNKAAPSPVEAGTSGPDHRTLSERDAMAGATVAQNIVRIQLGGHNRGGPIHGYTIVDSIDADLQQKSWANCQGYAKLCSGSRVKMHNVILARVGPVPAGKVCDHINGNGFDNRRENLRWVTPSQNQQNRTPISKNNTSGYRGVTWRAQSNKWAAEVRFMGRKYYCGMFDTVEEAAIAARKKREEFGFLMNRELPTPPESGSEVRR